ncbi:hypothetical protein P154DRAFT_522803 [Amniculicola lignicola CBS 123094]|uniref:Ring-like domain-containing protein n=1 Tax=Amniculicola lignicola CBS 123094 TaxID=1392246 RepID=A0A6A5WDQ2_9PLEO|nr:hypothetical protein P154DRAFT_522803 [Amniculicola lignicola CBS 123094]
MTSYFNIKKLRRQSKQTDSEELNAGEKQQISNMPRKSDTIHRKPISSHDEQPQSPVLDEEDERFLARLTALANEPEGPPPPLPERHVAIFDNGEVKEGKEAEKAVADDAAAVPLPMSPPGVTGTEDTEKGKEKKSLASYFALAQSKFKRDKSPEKKDKGKEKANMTNKDRETAADNLLSAANVTKSSTKEEAQKEQQDLSQILDDLNLSAVNNRVFSFSKESTELLDKFKLVLKDVVNGAPTAYGDIEKLFTDYDAQIKKLYGQLPPFLQSLIKSLPAKITAALGPELLAAQADKPGFDAKQASGTKSKRPKIPSLKSLISAEGAVATMLRSILSFLKLRFPAVLTGTNVLMSLAVFILLFVFWYCYKRGRDTRLENERLAAEGDEPLPSSASSFTDNGDADSLLGESSKTKEVEKPTPALIIQDGAEKPSATVQDMPSVLNLPEPTGTPLKEAPLPVPNSR